MYGIGKGDRLYLCVVIPSNIWIVLWLLGLIVGLGVGRLVGLLLGRYWAGITDRTGRILLEKNHSIKSTAPPTAQITSPPLQPAPLLYTDTKYGPTCGPLVESI